MKIFGYDKPVKEFNIDYRSSRGSAGKYQYVERAILHDTHKDAIIELTSTKRTLKQEWFGTLDDSGVLCFDKSATFPRYKLEGTNYKRCIKVDKADYIIVGEVNGYSPYSEYKVYEDNDYLYITYNYSLDKAPELMKENGIYAKEIYCGRIVIYSPKDQILLQTPPKPLIWDKDLNKAVDKDGQEMTLEDAKQIITMLTSPDDSVVDLGLKLLAGFSVEHTPFAIKAILLTNKSWVKTNAKTSVGVKTMLDALNIKADYSTLRFPYNISYLNDGKTYSEKDLKLGRSLLGIGIKNYIANALSREIEIFEGPNVRFKVDINVEEK